MINTDEAVKVPVSKRDAKKIATRNKIIQTSINIFLEKGYQASTINYIAMEVGITIRTLYKYFSSKLELFIGAFDYIDQEHNQLIAEIVALDLPEDDILREIINCHKMFSSKYQTFLQMYWGLAPGGQSGNVSKGLLEKLNCSAEKRYHLTAEVVKRGQKKEVFADCDPQLLVHFISAVIKGISFHTNKHESLKWTQVDPDKLYGMFNLVLNSFLVEKK
jgi:AcrR family transcriptional regulator